MYDYDVISIGAGPGGTASAIRSADNGKKVCLIEKRTKNAVGGTCVNRGCIPTKALIASANALAEIRDCKKYGIKVESVSVDMKSVNSKRTAVINNLSSGLQNFVLKPRGIDLKFGKARFLDAHTVEIDTGTDVKTITGENIVIACGSEPANIPAFNIDGEKIVTSNEIMDVRVLPKDIVIVGAGAIGLEYGYMFNIFGVQVTIVEMMPNVVPTLHEPVITDAVRVALEKQGITVMTGVGIESIKVQEDGSVLSTLSNGDKLTSEKVLVAIGRMLNTNNLELENAGVECDKKGVIITDKHMRTNVSNIFAAGDVTTGPQLAHKAQRQGLVAAETIAGHEACMNYNVIPSTIFIEPQISIVGVTQTEAEKAGITTVCGTLPYSANEKAVALQKTEGIIKVVARADDHRIIGVQIFGHEAGNLISELCVVVEHEHTLEDVVNTEHPHPTITELVMEVCKDALGLAFHLQK